MTDRTPQMPEPPSPEMRLPAIPGAPYVGEPLGVPFPFFPDRGVHDCDDQLPVFSGIGRGVAGNSYKVTIDDPDTESETHLHGWTYDAVEKVWNSDWVSENINGGRLMYQYNLRPFTIPQTFTITFIYRRPGRKEWSWTTPAIPYVWTVTDEGERTDPDHIVGSGIATQFIRKTTEKSWDEDKGPWHETLVYPSETTRDDYNAPLPKEAWTSNITFGIHGDMECPNIDDMADILGIDQDIIRSIVDGVKGQILNPFGQGSDNIKDYIDDNDRRLLDDMGFPDGSLVGEGGPAAGNKWKTIKEYIDQLVGTPGQGGGTIIGGDGGDTTIMNFINYASCEVYSGSWVQPLFLKETPLNIDDITITDMHGKKMTLRRKLEEGYVAGSKDGWGVNKDGTTSIYINMFNGDSHVSNSYIVGHWTRNASSNTGYPDFRVIDFDTNNPLTFDGAFKFTYENCVAKGGDWPTVWSQNRSWNGMTVANKYMRITWQVSRPIHMNS